jgi:hypothetical protein
MADATAEARQEVVNARRDVEAELDQLASSTRAALDIPAKVKRHPVETIGVASGAAFLLLGGPERAAKAAERRFFPKRANRPPKLLPKDVDRALHNLPPSDRERVEAHLEKDFAAYLRKEHPQEPANARQSVWKTYDMLLGIVGAAAARELVKKLFAIPQETEVEAIEEKGQAVAEANQKVAEERRSATR